MMPTKRAPFRRAIGRLLHAGRPGRRASPQACNRSLLVVAGALLLGGCAWLPGAELYVGDETQASSPEAARILIDPGKPVLLRAVDGRLLPTIQVSNHLRPLTYVLDPGAHVLWLSELPAGIPFLPQRIGCFVLQVELAAGTRYGLELDPGSRLPVLRSARAGEPDSVGALVDRPLLIERGCKWQ